MCILGICMWGAAQDHVQFGDLHLRAAQNHVQFGDLHSRAAQTHVQFGELHLGAAQHHVQFRDLHFGAVQNHVRQHCGTAADERQSRLFCTCVEGLGSKVWSEGSMFRPTVPDLASQQC